MSGLEVAVFQVVSSFASWGTAGAVAAASVAVAKAVAYIAVATFAAKKAAGSYDPDLAARGVTTRGTTEPQQIIYGEALVSGPLAMPPKAAGIKNRELWNVVCLAGHEVESITDVHLDDRVITNTEINSGNVAGGVVNSGDFDQVRNQTVAAIYKYYGTSTQTVNTQLQTAIGASEWSTDHRLRGIAYIVTEWVLWDRTEKLWDTREPTNIRALVKGKKVYDPRLDTSPGANPDSAIYIAWSDNPALCAADFMRDSKFGPRPAVPASRIDWDSVVTAANDCDVLVATPAGNQKRFTCNGALFASALPEENLQHILSSMNGAVLPGAEYVIKAGVYTAPAAGDELTVDDLAGPISKNQALDPAQRVNTIKANYIDPSKSYKVQQTLPITSQTYLDRDNGDILERTIELPMTNNWFMAQRVAIKQLASANLEETFTVPCNLRSARFAPGDRITVTIPRLPPICRVKGWNLTFSGERMGVELQLQRDDSGAYADPASGEYDTELADGTFVDAELEPIPELGSIPEGIQYGGGAWNIQAYLNQTDEQVAEPGEIGFSAGIFVTPGGLSRTIQATVATPYDSIIAPPDGYAYIISGAANPDTRFGLDDWGDNEASGLFCAIFDRIRGQWYAVSNTNTEYAFTPAADDVAIVRFIKFSTATIGLEQMTTLVPYVENPNLDRGTTLVNSLGFGWGSIDPLVDLGVTVADGSVGGNAILESLDNGYVGGDCVMVKNTAGQGSGFYTSSSISPKVGVFPTRIPAQRRWIASAYVECANLRTFVCQMWVSTDGTNGNAIAATAANETKTSAASYTRHFWEFDQPGSLSTYTFAKLRFFSTALQINEEMRFDGLMLVDVTDYPHITADNADQYIPAFIDTTAPGPAGDDGATGATGATGPQGPAGVTGFPSFDNGNTSRTWTQLGGGSWVPSLTSGTDTVELYIDGVATGETIDFNYSFPSGTLTVPQPANTTNVTITPLSSNFADVGGDGSIEYRIEYTPGGTTTGQAVNMTYRKLTI